MGQLLRDLRTYQRAWLPGDIAAAVTIWAILVPESVAYAGIAGVPPEVSSESFSITVGETNTPPQLEPIGPQTVEVGEPMLVVVEAVDTDFPVQTVSYELGTGSPAGMIVVSAVFRLLVRMRFVLVVAMVATLVMTTGGAPMTVTSILMTALLPGSSEPMIKI